MDLQKHEKLKEEMKKDWEMEIVNPNDLLKTSCNFFLNLTYDYSIRCLFIEFLDFQIFLKGKIDEKVMQLPFPPLPNFDSTKFPKKATFSNSAEAFLANRQKNSKSIDNIKFLIEDPYFNYYFWNITFPHMFCEFISNELCERAKLFLMTFWEYEDLFLQGSKSFISHNYNFQDYFMKLYFINSQENEDPVNCIQLSLEKSIERLTIYQLDILEILFKDKKEKAKTMFLDIIVNSIKLWKYSPLFSSPKIQNAAEELINELEKTDLDTFFAPIIQKINLKITSNDIYINHLIINELIKHAVTLLDLLILEKITESDYSWKIKSQEYFDKLKTPYFLKEASFSYSVCDLSPAGLKKDNFSLPKLEKTGFDQNIVKNWDTYKEECISRNKNPLEFISSEKLYKEFVNTHGQELAIVGVQLSYNEKIYLAKIRDLLLYENRALIPFKADIDCAKSFTQLYSNYYASTFPFNHDSFVKDIKDLYVNFFEYNLISALNDKLNLEKIKEINDRLYKNFNDIFNTNNPDMLINEYKLIKEDLSKAYLKNIDDIIKSLKLNFEFLSYLTKSQLVVSYSTFSFKDETKEPILKYSVNETIKSFDFKSCDVHFKKYLSTGIFSYIYYNIYSKENKFQMGNFLTFVSEICYLLPQFIEGDNANYLKNKLFRNDEIELTLAIFIYSLKFKEIDDKEIEETINSLIRFLMESYYEIKKLMANVPNLFELYDQICYLLKYLGIKIDEENDSKEINETDSTKVDGDDSTTENQCNNNE